jgi:hypothetical protein
MVAISTSQANLLPGDLLLPRRSFLKYMILAILLGILLQNCPLISDYPVFGRPLFFVYANLVGQIGESRLFLSIFVGV